MGTLQSLFPRSSLSVLLTIFLLSSAFAAPVKPDRPDAPQQGIRSRPPVMTALTNARIITAPGQVIPKGTLLIENGRVKSVGEVVLVPPGVVTIDMAGKTIYPGFVDPITNYGLEQMESAPRNPFDDGDGGGPHPSGNADGALGWNDAIHAARNWVTDFKADPKKAEDWLSQGITCVQSARLDGIFRGTSFVTLVSSEMETAEAVLNPAGQQFLSFDKGSSPQDFPQSLMGSIALLRQTFMDRDWYRSCLAMQAKTPAATLPIVSGNLAALAAYNGKFLFDASDDLSLLRAAKIAGEFQGNYVYVGSNLEYEWLGEIARVKAPIILPLNFPRRPKLTETEDRLDVSLADLRFWERAPRNARVLDSAGIPIAFTTLRLKEKSEFLKGVRKAVAAGLPRDAALKALTITPAELIGARQWVGSLETGKLANFIVTGGDIFDDTTTLYSVWVNGRSQKVLRGMETAQMSGRFELTGWKMPLTFDLPDAKDWVISKSSGGGKIKFSGANRTADHFVGSFALDSLGGTGIGQLEVRRIGHEFNGQITDDKGMIAPLTVSLKGAVPEKSEKDSTGAGKPEKDEHGKKDAPTDTAMVSRLTYPNVGLGLEHQVVPQNVLVKNATIWTADKAGILEQADMLVTGGKIAKIGKNLTAPAGTLTIDATGKQVTPGIIDEHSHICISQGVNDAGFASSAMVRIGDVINSDDVAMYRALAGGVTTIHCLHGSANPIGGQLQVIKLKWGEPPDRLKFSPAPPTIKFALGENVKQSNWGDRNVTRYPQTRMGVESFYMDKFQSAKEYAAARAAQSGKNAPVGVMPVRRDLELECLAEIINGQRFIHCHSYVQSEILALMRVAEHFNFKIQTFTHILEGYKVAPEMARHGATASAFADWWAYKYEVYEAIPQDIGLMTQAGIVSSVNSDSNEMMRRLNQEAAKSMKYTGMTPLDAIKLCTINPAIQLKIDSRIGSLAEGKDADFVIWSGSPLSMMSKVEQTWIDGGCYFSLENDIAARKADAAEREKLIQKVLAATDDDRGSGPTFDELKQFNHEYECEDVVDVWRARHDQAQQLSGGNHVQQ